MVSGTDCTVYEVCYATSGSACWAVMMVRVLGLRYCCYMVIWVWGFEALAPEVIRMAPRSLPWYNQAIESSAKQEKSNHCPVKLSNIAIGQT